LKISEQLIWELTNKAIDKLGANASPDLVRDFVEKEISKIKDTSGNTEKFEGRVIITAFGINKPGIVARITGCLANMEIDLQDISQKIMQNFFTLIMIIDITSSPKNLKEIQEELAKVASELNVKIYAQHEDIFQYMFRI
jgi:ACT domain-containing protein